MESDQKGGCSMIVAPNGEILKDMGKAIGSISADIEPKWKYMRTAGFGGDMIRNDDFINQGLCPDVFKK
jgi:predicted amidohydrolase